MRKKGWLVYVVGLLLIANIGYTQSESELLQKMQKQIDEMQKRLNDLEQQNLELKNRLEKQEETTTQQKEKVDLVESAVVESTKKEIKSKWGADLYGYVKLDASYDTNQINPGNFALRVDQTNTSDDQFNMTANQTRLGLKFHTPEIMNAIATGQVEFDLYGGGGVENKPNFRMRHAFMNLNWPEPDISLLAGQTWDVMSPLVPPTVNFTVGWQSGNIGFRHPQIRLTKGFDLGSGSEIEVQTAIARNVGDNFGVNNPGDTGEASGIPSVQGRIAYTFPNNISTLGLSGHWGQDEIDTSAFDDSLDVDTWSGNLDLTIMLLEKLRFKGEAFYGENLDDFFGGIGQGVIYDPAIPQAESIRSFGGWGAFSIGPWGNATFNVGAGIDSPFSDDLLAGGRLQNYNTFANVFYKLNDAMITAFETSYWETHYKGQGSEDSVRFQLAFIYSF